MNDNPNPVDGSSSLCIQCGLCCNGVIFADVQLQAGDDPARLQALGLILETKKAARPPGSTGKPTSARRKFPQPCAAFEGCRCRIYADRPEHCRAFECLLLKSVKAGSTGARAAMNIIGEARRRVDVVKRLLQQLGEEDERRPLRAQFRRAQKRAEQENWDTVKMDAYSDLTLAMHDLNLILSEKFYVE